MEGPMMIKRTHNMNKQDVTITYFVFLDLLLLIIGTYEWTIANEVVHDAVSITLLMLGPITILNSIATIQLYKGQRMLEKEEGKKDEA